MSEAQIPKPVRFAIGGLSGLVFTVLRIACKISLLIKDFTKISEWLRHCLSNLWILSRIECS